MYIITLLSDGKLGAACNLQLAPNISLITTIKIKQK
jgi:hypothetical protein